MTFQEALAGAKKEVERGLVAFFVKKRQEAKQVSPHCLMLVDSVAEFTMRGGKRTRAFLVWLGYQTAAENTPDVKAISHTSGVSLHAMLAIELFQSFALIHDDIIDEDTVRRGGPTVHEQLGVPMAILAGDLALVWADELMGRVKSQKLKVKSEDIYQAMKQEVIFGQSLDVMKKQKKIGISKQLIDVYKTAWYSVIRPIQIGAVIDGADEKTLESFIPYGLAIGEGYQLRDDFLDGDIEKHDFDRRAAELKKRAFQAIKKIKMSESATILFIDFIHFVFDRSV